MAAEELADHDAFHFLAPCFTHGDELLVPMPFRHRMMEGETRFVNYVFNLFFRWLMETLYKN